MENYFDQFDSPQESSEENYFDQFDSIETPVQEIDPASAFARPPKPEETPGVLDTAGGLVRNVGRGLAHGTLGLAETVGTGLRYAGAKTDSEGLRELGTTVEDYWKKKAEGFEIDPSLGGSVFDDPGLMASGAWWAYNVSEFVPSIAASIIPGVGTAGLIARGAGKTIQIGSKAIKLTPKVITRLARMGGMLAGGAVGGSLEGAQTFKEVMQRTGDESQAAAAAEIMTLGSGALNALSVNRYLAKLPNDVKGRIAARGIRGLVEGITEYLEEPLEAGILYRGNIISFDEAVRKLKDGLNVLGPAMVAGAFFPGAGIVPSREGEAVEPGAVPADDVIGEDVALQPTGVDSAAQTAPTEPATQGLQRPEPAAKKTDDLKSPDILTGKEAKPDVAPEVSEARPEEDVLAPEKPAKKPRKAPPPDESKDSLLTVIAKLGGISRGEAEAEGVDPANFNDRRGPAWQSIGHGFPKPVFPSKGGNSMDGMAELVSQYGFLSDPYTGNELLELIDRELGGTKVYSLANRDSELDRMLEERAFEEPTREEMTAAGYDEADEIERGITDIKLRADQVLGDDQTDAIIERLSVAGENMSDEEYNQALTAALQGAIDESKTTAEIPPGPPGVPGGGEGASVGVPAQATEIPPTAVDLAPSPGEVTQPPLPPAAPPPTDLLGEVPVTAQAIADAARRTEPKEFVAPDMGEGRLFERKQEQADVEDVTSVKPPSIEEKKPEVTPSGRAVERTTKAPERITEKAVVTPVKPEPSEPEIKRAVVAGEKVEVNVEPTEAQKEAGNYQKGHVSFQGLDISIENPAGSQRRPEWPPLKHHYGYIKGTVGKDKDHLDVFIGPNTKSTSVYVVDQVRPDSGAFDEHKIMLGFTSKATASAGYLANYEKGWKGLGQISSSTIDGLKTWIAEGDTKKPFAPQVSAKEEPITSEKPKGEEAFKVKKIAAEKKPPASEKPAAQSAPPTEQGGYTIKEHRTVFKRIRDGDIKADELHATFRRARDSEQAIKAELNVRTLKSLAPGGTGGQRKSAIVDSIYDDILSTFALGSFTWSPFQETKEVALERAVMAGTDEQIQKEAKERKDRIEQNKKSIESPETIGDYRRLVEARGKDALTPEQSARYDELRADVAREDLVKEEGRRATVQAAGQTVASEVAETKHTKKGHDLFVVQPAERVEREVYNAWNAAAKKLGGYYSSYRAQGAVPGFQFLTRDAAETFKKFVTEGDTAAATEMSRARRDEYADNKEQSAVERLRDMAGRLEASADASLSQDRKTNTARRAGMASSAEAAARADVSLAKTMRRIADAVEAGKVRYLDRVRQKVQVETLSGLLRRAHSDEAQTRAKAEAEGDYDTEKLRQKYELEEPTTDTAKFVTYPLYTAFRSDLARLGRGLSEVDGAKQIGTRILKIADDVTKTYLKFVRDNLNKVSLRLSGGAAAAFSSREQAEASLRRSPERKRMMIVTLGRGKHVAVLSPAEAMDRKMWEGEQDKKITLPSDVAEEAILKATAHNAGKRYAEQVSAPYFFDTVREKRGRLRAMGINDEPTLRAAMREFVSLRVEAKKPDRVKQLERALVGNKGIGIDFFPTPPGVAADMVAEADIQENMTVLEPSAGTGNIADAIREAGANPDVAEMSYALREILEAKGYNVVANDFMSMQEERYDRIVMNPPFGKAEDVNHVRHAYGLLKPGGRVVAVMGEGSFTRGDKRATAFREWLDEIGGTDEKLPPGTFIDPSLIKTTGASARVVVIDKSSVAEETRVSLSVVGGGEPRPTFYSNLQDVVSRKLPGSGTAEIYRQALKSWVKAGQIKQDEYDWSGVDQWLSEQTGKLSKAAVLDFLRANEIRVSEVERGENLTKEQREQVEKEGLRLYDLEVADRLEKWQEDNESYIETTLSTERNEDGLWEVKADNEVLDTLDNEDDAQGKLVEYEQKYMDEQMDEAKTEIENSLDLAEFEATAAEDITEKGQTVFERYTLPGGENYRELLLRLPTTEQTTDDVAIRLFGKRMRGLNDADRDAVATEMRVLSGSEKKDFRGGHFDEPNVLAHVRFNERTDTDGKRVLFIEEIQSDWHQLGRRRGYKELPDREAFIQWATTKAPAGTGLSIRGANEAWDSQDSYVSEWKHTVKAAVPDAPFKTTWPLLAFKRMIRYASENGFEKIAWTTGGQQAERYDLSKYVREITYRDNGDGTYDVAANKDNYTVSETVWSDGKATPEIIEKTLGKDILRKIENGEGREEVEGADRKPTGLKSLMGLDLKIGGEGMKAFYDKILPATVNKYVKKWGSMVGETTLPEVKLTTAFIGEGIFPYSILDEHGDPWNQYRTKTAADAELRELREAPPIKRKGKIVDISKWRIDVDDAALAKISRDQQAAVHSIDITAPMREGAIKGQPLFSLGDQVKGRGLSRDSVKLVAEVFMADWRGRPEVIVARNISELPKKIVGDIDEAGITGTIRGAYNNGKVYLVSEGLGNVEQVKVTILHETIGHYGLRRILGDKHNQILNQVYLKYGREELQPLIDIYYPEGGFDPKNRDHRLFIADEKLARIVQQDVDGTLIKRPPFLNQLYAAVRNWLRGVGVDIKFTDADIAALLYQARQTVLNGGIDLEPESRGQRSQLSLKDQDDNVKKEVEKEHERFLRNVNAGQPIDKIFRVPFQVLGVDKLTKALHKGLEYGVTEFNFEKDGFMSWMNPMLQNMRAGLIDRYGVPEDFRKREFQRQAEERKTISRGMDFIKDMHERGMNIREARVLQAVLSGEEIDAGDWAEVAEPVRKAIDDMGQEAVLLGLISEESYNRNKGKYLHRVYRAHETTQDSLGKWVSGVTSKRRKKIIGDTMKGRGMEQRVGMDRVLRDSPPGWWGRKIEKGQADKQLSGKKFHIFDKFTPAGDGTETVPGIEEAGKKKRMLARVYWPADTVVPTKYESWEDRGVWEVRGTSGDKLILWRDFTKEEREKMGEIVDARYTIAKTFQLMAHDIASARFFSDIAKNPNWAWAGKEEPPNSTTPRGRLATYTDVEWIRVPDTPIPDTGGKKAWGDLAGRYVRAEIWRDLNELNKMQNPGTWRRILTQWKLNKTARNPVVHLNNIMSNFLFMDMADVRMRDLKHGIYAWRHQTDEYKDAKEHGAFGSSYIEHEIRRDVLDPLLEEIARENVEQEQTVEGKVNTLRAFSYHVYQAVKKIDNKFIDTYQLEDEIFRMAMYIRRLSLGDDAATAAMTARDQFLNYDIRAPWINALRNSFLPFLSYTYRAVPVIAKSIAERPWKIAKYSTVVYLLNALSYAISPGDEDEERRSMRDQIRGRTWVGTPRMIRMPWRDQWDNPVFIDVRRWIPAGDVFDMNQGNMAIPIPAPFQFSGPITLAGEFLLNKQAFTGREIVNWQVDDAGDAMLKVGGWAWKSWMPSAPWVPGSWYFDKIMRSLRGGRDVLGRRYDPGYAFLSSVGVKVAPQDVELGFEYRAREVERTKNALNAEMRRIQKDKERKLISEETFIKERESLKKKMMRLESRAKETFKKTAP